MTDGKTLRLADDLTSGHQVHVAMLYGKLCLVFEVPSTSMSRRSIATNTSTTNELR